MEIQIVSVKRSAVFDYLLFVDVKFIGIGITIKGIKYNFKKNAFSFPVHTTETGKKFSPFLIDKELFSKFKEKFLDLMLDQKIPGKKEEISDEQKQKILDRDASQSTGNDVRRRLSGQKAVAGSRKA